MAGGLFLRRLLLERESLNWNPIAPKRRWGFLAAMTTAAMICLCAGCSQPIGHFCTDPAEVVYTAARDSLSLAAFLELPTGRQEARRQMAIDWQLRASEAGSPSTRVQALTNAAGLAPDDPEPWLQLAEVWRWVGDPQFAEACLENAATAIRSLDREELDGLLVGSVDYKMDYAHRTALARAWLAYDNAQWDDGRNWADMAARLTPGDGHTMLVRGLLAAGGGSWSLAREIAADLRRSDVFDGSMAWIYGVHETAQHQYSVAFDHYFDQHPDVAHATECWRDKGIAAERLGDMSHAKRWYEESEAALPHDIRVCLTKRIHPPLSPDGGSPGSIIWLAFDRYYVTGSLSAYTALAMRRFDEATSAKERGFWSRRVVDAASNCLRRDWDRAWALRARGLVFASKDMVEMGLSDLKQASALLERRQFGIRQDQRVEAALGHLLLKKERHSAALPHLRAAVALRSSDAEAWSDMGLCYIMVGQRQKAEAAIAEAIEHDPQLPAPWYNRGLMLLHAGEFDRAEADLQEAARLAPSNAEIRGLLQQLNVMRRKTEQAE